MKYFLLALLALLAVEIACALYAIVLIVRIIVEERSERSRRQDTRISQGWFSGVLDPNRKATYLTVDDLEQTRIEMCDARQKWHDVQRALHEAILDELRSRGAKGTPKPREWMDGESTKEFSARIGVGFNQKDGS